MRYRVQATLQPIGHEHGYGVTILKSNQTQLYTTIPMFNEKPIPLQSGDHCEISYFFGSFQFIFRVHFMELISDAAPGEEPVRLCHFVIDEMDFAPNIRKNKREAVDFNSFVTDAKGQYHGKVLDHSKENGLLRGVKLRLEEPLQKKSVTIFFFDETGETVEVKGKVMWEKKGEVYYYYGIKIV